MLVTGVAGFIGSNLLEKLLILNKKVVGLDNFDTGHQHNIDQAIEDAEKACNGVNYILHQAALGLSTQINRRSN